MRSVCIAIVAGSLMGGCAGEPPPPPAAPTDPECALAHVEFDGSATDLVVVDGPIRTLNPLFADTEADRRLQALIFDSLFVVDGAGAVSTRLVSSCLREPGAIQISLKDVKFHDGAALTAKDVCDSIEAYRTVARSDDGNLRQLVSGCEVKGERDLTVKTGVAGLDLRSVLAAAPILPSGVPHDQPGLDFDWRPVGTGAMRPASMAPPPEVDPAAPPAPPPVVHPLEMVSVGAAHHPAPAPRYRVLDWRTDGLKVEDVLLKLKNGEAQGWLDVPPERQQALQAEGFTIGMFPARNAWLLSMNTTEGPLVDPNVREAFANAADTKRIRNQQLYYSGKVEYVVLSGGPWRPSEPWNQQSVPMARASSAKANQLMRDAGWNPLDSQWFKTKTALVVRLAARETDIAASTELLPAIQRNFEEFGAIVDVTAVPDADWGAQRAELRQKYDLVLHSVTLGVGGAADTLFGPGGKDNLFDHRSPALDAALEKVAKAGTVADRDAAMRELHTASSKEKAWMFLWIREGLVAWRGAPPKGNPRGFW